MIMESLARSDQFLSTNRDFRAISEQDFFPNLWRFDLEINRELWAENDAQRRVSNCSEREVAEGGISGLTSSLTVFVSQNTSAAALIILRVGQATSLLPQQVIYQRNNSLYPAAAIVKLGGTAEWTSARPARPWNAFCWVHYTPFVPCWLTWDTLTIFTLLLHPDWKVCQPRIPSPGVQLLLSGLMRRYSQVNCLSTTTLLDRKMVISIERWWTIELWWVLTLYPGIDWWWRYTSTISDRITARLWNSEAKIIAKMAFETNEN